MSLQSQIALGKNMSLQRQLDGKYVEFKRAFRSSRRRLDSFEEECVSSLYKLLLEAKANKMDAELAGRRSVTPDVTRGRSKSVPLIARPKSEATTPRKTSYPIQERPYTSMSSRTYTQSYSFKKDGLDLSKYTRGGVRKKQSAEESRRPLTVVGINPFSEKENSETQQRNVHDPVGLSHSQESQNGTESILEEHKSGNMPDTNSKPNERIRPATSILKNRKGDQILVKVHESNTKLDEFRPLSVTITHTTPLDHPIYSVDEVDSAISPRPDTAFEEELLPLINDNERSDTKVGNSSSPKTIESKRKILASRNNTAQYRKFRASSRAESEDSEMARARSIQDQQKFLADYSRRSKLFGYVVKTKSASISQDKSRRISRSPCVTYQELVGIKSGMRQQESQTRMLVKRSAKLSTYVDQLAMASQYRQHIQALKSGTTPES